MKTRSFPYVILGILLLISFTINLFFANHHYKFKEYRIKVSKILEKSDAFSIKQQYDCNIIFPQSSVWLISYADGKPIHFANQKELHRSALNKCVDNHLLFGKKNIDQKFYDENRSIFSEPRGAGYWLWKPYIILQTLKKIPQNDILIYSDSGISITSPLDNLINELAIKDILIFQNPHTNRQYIKRDLLRIMDMDNDEVLDSMQLQAGFWVIKNTEFSRNFIEKWLTLCTNKHAIDDSASENEYEDFIDHRHDQAILSLLYLKEKEQRDRIVLKPYETGDSYYYLHRRRSVYDY